MLSLLHLHSFTSTFTHVYVCLSVSVLSESGPSHTMFSLCRAGMLDGSKLSQATVPN